ncbi:MAG: hypothetical protein SFV17_12325 [Candidatus Obscuribacter sp.]|nr:hypothetical protein [Candidatus Melainabacteria bacterium]MDX1987467.1 hypothetical protein [Candidatus Obscuribacter sp.]
MAQFENNSKHVEKVKLDDNCEGGENHGDKLVKAAYGDQGEAGDMGNDNTRELLRQNEAFIKQVQEQAERVVASIMRSFDALPSEKQEQFVNGIDRKNLSKHDVVYHTFLQNWDARQSNVSA